jgi:hypothetical protein
MMTYFYLITKAPLVYNWGELHQAATEHGVRNLIYLSADKSA